MSYENQVTDKVRDEVRAAIEDRAAWLYLILKELSKDGKIDDNPEISKAIFKFGQLKGEKMNPADTAGGWAKGLISPVGERVFEQKLVEEGDDKAVIEFSYCPLVEAWKKLDATSEEIATLCKIARCGDHGRISSFPLELNFDKLLAEGDDVCRLVVTKKNDKNRFF